MTSSLFRVTVVVSLAISVYWAESLSAQTAGPKQPMRTAQRSGAPGGAQPSATGTPDRPPVSRPARDAQSRDVPAQPPAREVPSGVQGAEIVKRVEPKAPFELTESQQKLLDQILLKWEKQSDKVRTFKCNFNRWEYDKAFGNPNDNNKKSEGQGEIRYKAPDCGEYLIASLREYDPAKKVESPKSEGLDHWLCDGKAIYEFNAQKKQLIERPLAPELQGKAISDGPLPFIFGAKADQLKRRYWMRDVTPKGDIGKRIWLEAIPKYQQDAANFQSATVILNDADCLPYALRIFLPGGASNSDYEFTNPKVNDPFAVIDYLKPALPYSLRLAGWKHVVDKGGSEDVKAAPPAAGEAPQAKRAAPNSQRK